MARFFRFLLATDTGVALVQSVPIFLAVMSFAFGSNTRKRIGSLLLFLLFFSSLECKERLRETATNSTVYQNNIPQITKKRSPHTEFSQRNQETRVKLTSSAILSFSLIISLVRCVNDWTTDGENGDYSKKKAESTNWFQFQSFFQFSRIWRRRRRRHGKYSNPFWICNTTSVDFRNSRRCPQESLRIQRAGNSNRERS